GAVRGVGRYVQDAAFLGDSIDGLAGVEREALHGVAVHRMRSGDTARGIVRDRTHHLRGSAVDDLSRLDEKRSILLPLDWNERGGAGLRVERNCRASPRIMEQYVSFAVRCEFDFGTVSR